MARPRLYTVHGRGGPWAAPADIVLVKEGFCWLAFVFTVLWSLWHRLWVFSLIVLATGVGIGLLSEALGLDAWTDFALGLAWALLVGYEANDARRRALARRGFELIGLTSGAGLADAERRHFAKQLHPAAAATT